MAKPPAPVDTRVWWFAGMLIDLVHMPLILLLVLLGATWFPGSVFISIVVVIVMLQVAFLGCPVMALSGKLKQRHDPEYENHWSITVWLYRRYGRGVGVGVFLFLLGLALLVRAMW